MNDPDVYVKKMPGGTITRRRVRTGWVLRDDWSGSVYVNTRARPEDAMHATEGALVLRVGPSDPEFRTQAVLCWCRDWPEKKEGYEPPCYMRAGPMGGWVEIEQPAWLREAINAEEL